MNIFYRYIFAITLSCVFTPQLFAVQTAFHFYEWGMNDLDQSLMNREEMIPLEEWQVFMGNQWSDISIPFVSSAFSKLNLRTTFNIDSSDFQKNLYLIPVSLKGAAEIYFNGKPIKFLTNASFPLKITLPSDLLLRKEKNTLEIRLKVAQKVEEGFPNYAHIFTEPNYLGITGPVILHQAAEVGIDNLDYTFQALGRISSLRYSFTIYCQNHILAEGEKIRIDYSLLSPEGRLNQRRIVTIQEENTTLTGELQIPLQQLWFPYNPQEWKLAYSISKSNTVIKQDTVKLSFRFSQFSNGQFAVNGEKIIVQGINYYQNYPALTTKSYLSQVTKDLKLIKKLGFNAIRCPDYFPNEIMFSIADTLGLLLFVELPIHRYPVPLFLSDTFLENVKASISSLKNFPARHPSFFALGIGQEVPMNEAAVQKFLLIVKSFAADNVRVLLYSSPLLNGKKPINSVTDFYVLDMYQPLQNFKPKDKSLLGQFSLLGKAGIITSEHVHTWDSEPSNIQRAKFLKQEIQVMMDEFDLQGGFIECYQDWLAQNPTHLTVHSPRPLVMPNGLLTYEGELKTWLNSVQKIWEYGDKSTLVRPNPEKQGTNFFTVLMFFATLLFFAIYRKQPRLKENVKRAVMHPYGFFVDMRERRIIPLFNSILVGSYASIILATYLASFFYYYYDSFWMQEILSIFLIPMGVYDVYLKVSSSPAMITLVFFTLLLFYPYLVSIVLFLISILSGAKIRLRQGMAIGLWSGIPLFFLLPLSMFGYHLLYHFDNKLFLFIVLGLFIIWAHFRIVNGIRVLFLTKALKVFIILLLSYVIPFLIFWAVFRPEPYWSEYLAMLLSAKNLF